MLVPTILALGGERSSRRGKLLPSNSWSDMARFTLTTSNCETVFSRLDCAKAAWQPYISIDLNRMFCNLLQVFLGVGFDPLLTFAEHERKLCQSMSGRFNFLRALGGSILGWHTSDCRQVYIAIVRSMLEYAAAAWEPRLSATSTIKHEEVQLEVD